MHDEEDDDEDENLFTKHETAGNEDTPGGTPGFTKGDSPGGNVANVEANSDEKIPDQMDIEAKEAAVFIPSPPSEPESEPKPQPEPDPETQRLEALVMQSVTDDDVAMLIKKRMVEKLVEFLQMSKGVPNQRKYINALFKCIEHHAVPQARFVRAGGLQILIQITTTQLENGGDLLFETIHFIG